MIESLVESESVNTDCFSCVSCKEKLDPEEVDSWFFIELTFSHLGESGNKQLAFCPNCKNDEVMLPIITQKVRDNQNW